MADKLALETDLRVGPAAASEQWIAAPPKDIFKAVHDTQHDTHAG